jgi:cupin 2 domain-containing protein
MRRSGYAARPESEWALALKAAARLDYGNGRVEVIIRNYLNSPAHKKHRVFWTTLDEPTIWLAVHYGGEE